MHLCDASVWVALSIGTHEHHPVATGWLASVEDEHTIFFCRATQQSLLRLLTTAAVTAPYGEAPMSNAQAWEAYRAFLADPRIVIRSDEPAELESHWRRYSSRSTASPKLWMDAYLAAFAVAGGLSFVTTDSGFRQFPGLPLVLLGE
jgi:toxin-antitoxin system PIN domain toxin